MSHVQTGNITHDNTVAKSEGARQAIVMAAGVAQATIVTAEIAHYRTALASALANNCGIGPFMAALKSLGVTGA